MGVEGKGPLTACDRDLREAGEGTARSQGSLTQRNRDLRRRGPPASDLVALVPDVW